MPSTTAVGHHTGRMVHVTTRSRSHELETESRLAFESRLPGWVYRPLDRPDYGLDGIVEIFNDERHTTGKLFYVLLKATDEASTKRALAIRFKTTTLNYYDSLKMPVLIVLWQAPLQRLYVRWSHARTRELAWSDPPPRQAVVPVTRTVRLDSELDLWNEATSQALLAQLDAFDLYVLGELKFPLSLWVKRKGDLVAPEVTFELRVLLSETDATALISVKQGLPPAGAIFIELGADRAVTSFGDAVTVTLHHGSRVPTAADLLTCVAIALARIRQPAMAAVLAGKVAAESGVVRDLESISMLGTCFILSHRIGEGLRLAEEWAGQAAREPTRAAEVLLAVTMDALSALGAEDILALEKFVRRRLAIAEPASDQPELVKRHLQLADLLGQQGRCTEALEHYELARRLDEGQEHRSAWWRCYAGMLFESERFSEAAVAYRRSLELGEEDVRPLLADATFFEGNYGEAHDLWDQYLGARSPSRGDAEWRLRSRVAIFITNRVCATQVRQPAEAKRLAAEALLSDKRGTVFFGLSWRAIVADACMPVPWFNLGVWFSESGREEEAFLSFLVAAVLARSDGEAWANAAALCLRTPGAEDLFPDIVITARDLSGTGFMRHTMELVAAQDKSFPSTSYFDVLGHVETAPEKELWMMGAEDAE